MMICLLALLLIALPVDSIKINQKHLRFIPALDLNPAVFDESQQTDLTPLQSGLDSNIQNSIYQPIPPSNLSPHVLPFASVDWNNAQYVNHVPLPPISSILAPAAVDPNTFNDKINNMDVNFLYQDPPKPNILKNEVASHFISSRLDSINPYCDLCIGVVNGLNKKSDATEADLCKLISPISQQDICVNVAKSLKVNNDASTLIKNGCIDKTGQVDKIQLRCPGAVACNVIESLNGSPMCGYLLRSWGDFIASDAVNRPLRPYSYDINLNNKINQKQQQKQLVPYNSFATTGKNPHCDICVEVVNEMNLNKDVTLPVCTTTPTGAQRRCDTFSKALKINKDAIDIFSNGCIDLTSAASTELPAYSCSGIIACNIITDRLGGPICGGFPSTIGILKAKSS